VFRWQAAEVGDERGGEPVPGQDVEALVDDDGRQVREVLQQPLYLWPDLLGCDLVQVGQVAVDEAVQVRPFQAFGLGDIDAVLSALAADVRWSNAGPSDLDYFGVRTGRDEVAEVFEILGREFDIAEFVPVEFFVSGNRAAALLRLSATIRSTGKSFSEDLVHIWTFGQDGLVTQRRDIQDSAAVADALRP